MGNLFLRYSYSQHLLVLAERIPGLENDVPHPVFYPIKREKRKKKKL
jgi:hypothetical protein